MPISFNGRELTSASSTSIRDSPLRPFTTKVQSSVRSQKMEDVATLVEQDLRDATALMSTNHLFRNNLDVDDSTINAVLRTLSSGDIPKYDSVAKHWTGMPLENDLKVEKDLYQGFVDIGTAVREICEKDPDLKKHIHAESPHWAVHADVTPMSLEDHKKRTAKLRGDIVAHMGETKQAAQDTLDESSKALSKAVAIADENEPLLGEAGTKDVSKKMHTWWVRIYAPMEVKVAATQAKLTEGIQQLCRYMKLVLTAQLDRRFVVGLLLNGFKLSVWLCDRAGLIGTQTLFDINKEPKRLIQLFLAFLFRDPAEFGFDRNMKIVCPDHGIALHSTDPRVTPKWFGTSSYQTRWHVNVPKDGALDAEDEWFETIGVVSIVRSENMTGRATLVWVVKPIEVPHGIEVSIYVLKQAWRPSGSSREADLRGPTPMEHVCDIVRSVDAIVLRMDGSGASRPIVDDTHACIRYGGTGTYSSYDLPLLLAKKVAQSSKRKLHDVDNKNEEYRHVIFVEDVDLLVYGLSTDVRKIEHRTFTRTLMKTYGWPLQRFLCIPELSRVTTHYAKGLSELRVVGNQYRDPSPGNVVISPARTHPDYVEQTKGFLIDLDYSKLLSQFKPIHFASTSGPDDISALSSSLERKHHIKFPETLVRILLKRFGHTSEPDYAARHYVRRVLYVQNALRFPPPPNPMTAERLLLDVFAKNSNASISLPDLDSHEPGAARSGTLPFMSAEILTGKPYFPTDDVDPRPVVHGPIHDLESLFWVVLYLCLTRGGPGGPRRRELSSTDKLTKEMKDIRLLVFCFFDSEDKPTLIHNKQKLFTEPRELIDYIFPRFAEYFQVEPLKLMLRDWFLILCVGYTFYDDIQAAFIHGQVIAVLEWYEEVLSTHVDPPEFHELKDKETERRKQDLQHLVNALLGQDSKRFAPLASPPESPPTRMVGVSGSAATYNQLGGVGSASFAEEPPSPTPKSKKVKT